MAILINDVSARIQYTATSGQTVFTVPFEFFENSDLKVYQGDTLLTITTHYTVVGAGVTGGGTVTFVTGATAGDIISIVRDVPVKRVTDFPVSGPFNINALNEDLDRLTAISQQQETRDTRTFRLADFDTPTSLNTVPSKANRAGKVFAFDSNGQPIAENEIGEWKGNWAASTAYAKRDIVKDASNSNVYRANTAHTSSGSTPISSNADAAKWDLVVDAAAAGASAAAAAASEAAAAASEAAAASSETAAAASETAAASSASSASSAQSAAESARDATLAAYDNFDDRYLGAKASDPTLDNDGNALVAGALYFNSTTGSMRLYTGSAWVAAYVSGDDYQLKPAEGAFVDGDKTKLDGLSETTFATKAAAEAYDPATAPDIIATAGYSAAADGGGWPYATAEASEPTGDVKLQIAEGTWYFPRLERITPMQAAGAWTAAGAQAAADYVENHGGVLLLPRRDYTWTAGITLASNTVVEIENGATLDISGAADGTTVFTATGTIATGIALSSDASKGDTSVSVSAGAESGFAAGDYVHVYAETVFDTGWTGAKFGEVAKVYSTSSGTINLYSQLRADYVTADTAKISKITYAEAICLIGELTVTGDAVTNGQSVFQGTLAKDVRIQGIRSEDMEVLHYWFLSCVDSYYSDLEILRTTSASSGYGINISSASENIVGERCRMSDVRHAVTNTAASGYYGVVRNIVYRDMVCDKTNNTGDAFDTHANAENVLFDNCESRNSSSTDFNIECASATIRNCRGYGSAGTSIRLSVGSTEVESDFLVEGGSFEDAGSYGCDARPASNLNTNSSKRIELVGVNFQNATQSALIIGNGTSNSTTLETYGLSVIGGNYDGNNVNGSIYIGYDVWEASIHPTRCTSNLAGGSCLQTRGAHIAIGPGNYVYTATPNGTSSSAAIRITDGYRTSVVGARGRSRTGSHSSSYGVRQTGTAGTVTAYTAANDFNEFTTPGTI